MVSLKLALRNLAGARLRTVLNVGVLSFIYVLVIWHQGLFEGMYSQSIRFSIEEQIGGGQYWHSNYDPYNPISISDSHAPVPPALKELAGQKKAAAVLIRQASMYLHGRIQAVLIRGIEKDQTILNLPTIEMQDYDADVLPVMVGTAMARKNRLKIGDTIIIRLRDANGTYDAVEGKVTVIMKTYVASIDTGNLWVPLDKLQTLYDLKKEASMVVLAPGTPPPVVSAKWKFRDQDDLLKDIIQVIASKRRGSFIMYIMLLGLSLMAIFDTQVLSIFRRKKEIGTLMALGMNRLRVITLFTVEGAMNGILALVLALFYGAPALMLTAKVGIPMPAMAEQAGLPLATRLFGEYSPVLVFGTVIIIMLTVTLVSYLPSRRISGLKPTEALRGNL